MTARGPTHIVHLVRHADTLARSSWTRSDALRPLSKSGMRQAEALAERLAPAEGARGVLLRAVSSPALRCRQTIEPAASRAGLDVEDAGELMEGGDPLLVIDLLADAASSLPDGAALAACTHGDVIDGVLETFGPSGVAVLGPLRAPKGVVWELALEGGRLTSARFVPPPSGEQD